MRKMKKAVSVLMTAAVTAGLLASTTVTAAAAEERTKITALMKGT